MDLRTYLFLNNIKQQKVYEDTGFTQATISRIVRGKCGLSRENAQILSDWTKGEVPVDMLIDKRKRLKCEHCGSHYRK